MRVVLCFAVALGGCSAADVSPELDDLSNAVTEIDVEVTGNIEDLRNVDVAARRARAAELGEPWFYSEGCVPVPLPGTDLEDCTIVVSKRQDVRLNADVIAGKWRTISSYITSLEVLASAKNDDDLLNAFAAAKASLGGLGEAAGSNTIGELVKDLEEDREKIDASVSFLLKNARMRRLRSVVREAEGPFQQVVEEISLAFVSQDTEAGRDQQQAYEDLIAAQLASAEAATQGPGALEAALLSVETEREAFLKASRSSVFYRLAKLADVHTALANRVRQRASVDEVAAFLAELAQLKDTLEE